MDLDLAFISSVLREENGYARAVSDGVTSTMLEGQGAIGWNFIVEHVKSHMEVPSPDLFTAKTRIQLLELADNLNVFTKELKDRYLFNRLRGAHDEVGESLERGDPHGALEHLQETMREAYQDSLTGSKTSALLSYGDEVLEFYNRMKNHEYGIMSPWQAMNEQTLGWWDGDLIVFVARMGVGKTFCLLMLAMQAWEDGKRILFVGTEMSRAKLAIRFYALKLKLPYDEFRHGRLGMHQEQRLMDGIGSLTSDRNLFIVGDDFDTDVENIEAAIEEVRPDVLIVDGMYLVKNKGVDRHTRVSNTADDLKRIAKRWKIPVIASTQFNRKAGKQNDSVAVTAENIGITDVIGWNSDVVFAMFQDDELEEDELMEFRPLKIREGKGKKFCVNWNFEDMAFDETTRPSYDGEYDDGVDYEGGDRWDKKKRKKQNGDADESRDFLY
jgi:replicative DNA helicase